MDVSMGTMIGQLVGLALVVTLVVVVVRLLIAATRRMNRQPENLQERAARSRSRDSGAP